MDGLTYIDSRRATMQHFAFLADSKPARVTVSFVNEFQTEIFSIIFQLSFDTRE